ncbi:DUF4255 domain-containing protein [Pendulispora rubella]|uniref:DUF4255 domain-containing protein n=1 Tax=Pendulispora rubella TaxID=2741070 RepID=A0ABZ2LHL0_9BACT
MSDAQAIYAVTATLKRMLEKDEELKELLGSQVVTVRPPDKARDSEPTKNQINLFLYGVTFNAAYRNMDMPDRGRSGEAATPPLALDLHYLLTAYGEEDDRGEPKSHAMLSRAMLVFHETPVLAREAIQNNSDSNLNRQIERVRITPQTLTIEDLYKLWTTFQAPYRVSTAYQVSVVLIEGEATGRRPLPVLRRGKLDRGWPATAAAPPVLSGVRLPLGQPGARLRDRVFLLGTALEGVNREVRFTHGRFGERPTLKVGADATATTLPVTLDETPGPWWTGIYSVSVRYPPPIENDIARTTNEVALVVIPTVTNIAKVTGPNGPALRVECSPPIAPNQRAIVLLDDHEFPATGSNSVQNRVQIDLGELAAGTYVVRLRVDGVDSSPVDIDAVTGLPEFSPKQTVTLP